MTTGDTGGERMERPAAERFLAEQGVGVLSLADGDDAYGVPLSFGYDADRETVYFVLLCTGEMGLKEVYVETTERATFTVHEVLSAGEWRSAVVRGPVRPVEESEYDHATAAIDTTAWYPDLFREATPTRGIDLWALEVEQLTGLRGGETDDA